MATDGDDDNPGSREYPFATLNHALDQVEAGNTIVVRGGTYRLKNILWIGKVGTAKNRITLRAYPGEKVKIDCRQTPNNTTCISIGGQYIDIIGLEVSHAQRTGISVWGGSHIRILDNTIHHSQGGGIYAGYDSPGTVRDILVAGNTVYRNCQNNNPPPPDHGSGWSSGIGIFLTDHATVSNNRVYENYGEGIILGLMDDGIASGNIVYDNYSVGMYIDNSTNTVYKNNFIYTTNNSEFFRFDMPSPAIQMANETYEFSNPNNDNQILNNIVVGGRRAFSYGSYQNGGGLKNVVVANNTFYQGRETLINIDEDEGHKNTVFVNNIFYQVDGEPMLDFAGDNGISFHHNNWYGGEAGVASGEGDIIGDPMLYHVGSLNPQHYRLTVRSTLIDVGAPVATVQQDYFGTLRPAGNGHDIGAYEWPDTHYIRFPVLICR